MIAGNRERSPVIAFFMICAGLLSCTLAPAQEDCIAEKLPAAAMPSPCPNCRADRDFWCSECAARSGCKTCGGSGWVCTGDNTVAQRDLLQKQQHELARINTVIGTKLRSVETPRLRLFTDVDHRLSHKCAQLFERYIEKFNDTFDRQPEEKIWRDTCDVYLFNSRETFEKFATSIDARPQVAGSGGYSCPSSERPRAVLFKDSRNDQEASRAIVHELAHIYLALFHTDRPLPDWVQEGVAQDFEFSYKASGSRRKDSLKVLRNAIENNTLMTLPELSQMKFTPDKLLPYAASWSAVGFLTAKDRPSFGEFVKLMKEGKDQDAALAAAFGMSFEAANAAWRQYVARMK